MIRNKKIGYCMLFVFVLLAWFSFVVAAGYDVLSGTIHFLILPVSGAVGIGLGWLLTTNKFDKKVK